MSLQPGCVTENPGQQARIAHAGGQNRIQDRVKARPADRHIRFFLLAVYATMYVRDHMRPAFHKALGIDPTDYDYRVFRITSEISRQVFPFTLDIDHPAFRKGLDRLLAIVQATEAAKARGGLVGRVQRLWLGLRGAATFARLYTLPVVPNDLPRQVRLAPAW